LRRRPRCGREDQRGHLFQLLLDGLDLVDTLVTSDAMHVRLEHAHYLVETEKAHFVVIVKGNHSHRTAIRRSPVPTPPNIAQNRSKVIIHNRPKV
jgi:hypothetical protein